MMHKVDKKIQFKTLENPELCNVIITSVLTEKSVFLEENYNIIILIVKDKYNKFMIKNAVESVFTGVKVISVNTMNYKPTLEHQRGKRYIQSGYKKAYVRLTKDSTIELGENQTAITRFTPKNIETKTEGESQ